MPYKNIEDLPKKIRKILPKEAQKLFVKVFNQAYKKHDEATAFKIAWAVIKKKYIKSPSGRWILKANKIRKQYVKANSDWGDELKFIEFVVASPQLTSKRERLHQTFIQNIGNRLVGVKGDLEHANLLNLDLPKEWVIKIIDSIVIDDEIHATAVFNSLHPYADVVWQLIKEGKVGASIELAYDEDDYYYDENGRVYVDGKIIGVALTLEPANKDAMVYHAYEFKAE